MNHAELCHRWANRVKPQGKAGNMFYDVWGVLYSYGHHYPLAVLTGRWTGGRELVLVNSRRYSVSTGKQKSLAVRASSHKTHIYVPVPENAGHPSNLTYLNEQTATACEALRKARSCISSYESTAREYVETAKLYRKVFLKGRGHIVPLPKDLDEILVKAREREARHNAAAEVKRERYRAAYAEQRRINALEAVEKIAAWRAGQAGFLPWGLPCMLRLGPSDTVQTSLGVEIPLSHAERVYRLVVKIMESGEDWQSNGHTIPVGVYKVDSIGKDGTLRAGCHTISFEEIQKFATERGWR